MTLLPLNAKKVLRAYCTQTRERTQISRACRRMSESVWKDQQHIGKRNNDDIKVNQFERTMKKKKTELERIITTATTISFFNLPF